MSGPQTQPQPKENVFGANGETIEESEITTQEVEEPAAEAVDPDENQDPDPDPVSQAGPAHKYRIGEKTFATQAEAIAYAESTVQPASEVDAYRQVLREVIAGAPRAGEPSVPVTEEFNADELYTDPKAFLQRRDERIKNDVLNQINQNQASRENDERIWSEFTGRHPDLTEYREEITSIASKHAVETQNLIRTKGQAAAYDYVATKFKAYADRVSSAIKPIRELKNGGAGAPAGGKVETVTPKGSVKKASTMIDQLRTIRRGR